MMAPDDARIDRFFAVVIGTGFAGAVTACRLVEGGHHICVLERGRRYGPDDFPKYPTDDLFVVDKDQQEQFAPPPDFSRWLWARDQGLYDIRDLDDAISVQAAGYGGGSLIYANVHLRPPRSVFNDSWPAEYRQAKNGDWGLDRYFDLAARMLGVSLIPKRLAKTLQLERAAGTLGGREHWFRVPLAINFNEHDDPLAGRRRACDMRARCDLGCDIQAKNTLDLNYLLRAERGSPRPDIRTLAEVTTIERAGKGFIVTYEDVLLRPDQQDGENCNARPPQRVYAEYVFLCAGALNTTELLLRNADRCDPRQTGPHPRVALGSHYFPNADSLAAVFDCDEPHEADYGPTITSALLFQQPETGEFRRSLDFRDGLVVSGGKPPVVGATVVGKQSGAHAMLVHDPILDWGRWEDAAAGVLVIDEGNRRDFKKDEPLDIYIDFGQAIASARARRPDVRHQHWFLAEDGGYPPNAEPLAGIFRSPFWLRRNRYVESAATPMAASPQRAPARRLKVESFRAAFAGTTKRTAFAATSFDRALDPSHFRTDLLADQITMIFPAWFVEALDKDRHELMAHAGAFALPMLGKLLDGIAKSVAEHVDADTLARLDLTSVSSSLKREVLVRGLLRQALQILAGSEDAIATKAAAALLEPVPQTPVQLLELLGDVLLWALSYGETQGHTGIVLVQGRDLYRGRLGIVEDPHEKHGRLRAWLPHRLLDTSSVMQERVLRVIATSAWHGELRTNPVWGVLGKRLTVHNQGGCPMGDSGEDSVTNAFGEVYGCSGLYVMDAAAFPTSVGVNPSATITAIAEFKIEHFLRKHRSDTSKLETELRAAPGWVDGRGRSDLDPLNHRDLPDNPTPALGVLGLTFDEVLRGISSTVHDEVDFTNLDGFPAQLCKFTHAEDVGAPNTIVEATLKAWVDDLARLVTRDEGVLPSGIRITGTIKITTLKDGDGRTSSLYRVVEGEDSFLRLFVAPPTVTKPPSRFFHYHLRLLGESSTATLEGLKVLRDAPGFDAWNDTSVLYFDIIDDDRHRSRQRGIMRISVEDFLRGQLPSVEITGTSDTARKSWALGAFYKYFATELAAVYVKRAGALKEFFVKLLTTIHV